MKLRLLCVFLLVSAIGYAQVGPSVQWTKTIGGSNNDAAYSVDLTTDGGFIVCGTTGSHPAEGLDIYLVRLDSLGDTLWTKTYGGIEQEEAFSIVETTDGGFVLAGYIYSFGNGSDDFYVARTDSIGDTLWTRTYGGLGVERAYSIQLLNYGEYFLTNIKILLAI